MMIFLLVMVCAAAGLATPLRRQWADYWLLADCARHRSKLALSWELWKSPLSTPSCRCAQSIQAARSPSPGSRISVGMGSQAWMYFSGSLSNMSLQPSEQKWYVSSLYSDSRWQISVGSSGSVNRVGNWQHWHSLGRPKLLKVLPVCASCCLM